MTTKKKQEPEVKEIVQAQGSAVAVNEAASLDEWGVPEISAKDTIIAKVFPMQMMSKKVIDEKAKFGELRDSVTNELLGSVQSPMEFIPIKVDKVWVESEFDGKEWKYKRTTPITAGNDDLPYEEVLAGVRIKRMRTYNALVLLPKEIESAVPKIISFRSTSMRAAQKLSTQMYVTNRAAKKSPASVAMLLSASKVQNPKGTFLVLDVEAARDTTVLEQTKALEWFKLMSRNPKNIKVDEQEENLDAPIADSEVNGVEQF